MESVKCVSLLCVHVSRAGCIHRLKSADIVSHTHGNVLWGTACVKHI